MINGIHVKICGITSLVDAEAADRIGADFLGFILWPKSPRHILLESYSAMTGRLPARKKVAVMVEPDREQLMRVVDAGFDIAQIHFNSTLPLERVAEWSHIMGPKKLWLAPKLPPSADVSAQWMSYAEAFLLDTFHADGFGGSGMTGDWDKFSRHRQMYPEKLWILAGGLNPDNVADAVSRSGARFVDVNSGVESSPGIKDHVKLDALARALRQR